MNVLRFFLPISIHFCLRVSFQLTKYVSYSLGQVMLHWLSAVVILWTLLSGVYVAIFEVGVVIRNWVGFVNVSLTVLYVPIFILRLYYSFLHGFSSPGRKRCIAEYSALLVHKAIYLTLGVVLLTGVLMMDRPINIFNVLLIAQLHTDPALIAWSTQVHVQACVMLLILVALHVGAVIKHEWYGHRVLKNMSFQKSIFK